MLTTYQQLGTQIGEMTDSKNAAYGSSFATAGPAMRLLYPAGIPAAGMDDALLIARIWDKLMRIATDRDALGESPYADIAGYGLLGAKMHHERKSKECGSVNDTDAAEESKAPGSSAAPSAVPQTTPNASEPSESNSRQPSSSPSQPTSASTAAPAPNAPALAFENVVDPDLQRLLRRAEVMPSIALWDQRNMAGKCAACYFDKTALNFIVRVGLFRVECCSGECMRFVDLNRGIA